MPNRGHLHHVRGPQVHGILQRRCHVQRGRPGQLHTVHQGRGAPQKACRAASRRNRRRWNKQGHPSTPTEPTPDIFSGPMLVELQCDKCNKTAVPSQFVCISRGQRLQAGHRASVRSKLRAERIEQAARIAEKFGVDYNATTSDVVAANVGEAAGRGERGIVRHGVDCQCEDAPRRGTQSRRRRH